MKADCFYYLFNRKAARGRGDVVSVTIDVPAGATLEEILAACPAGKGQATGIFEVQTDAGIWTRDGETPFVRKPAAATFRTWAEIEAAELEEMADDERADWLAQAADGYAVLCPAA